MFFETDEALLRHRHRRRPGRLQATAITSYARPKGATPLSASLVPAYAPARRRTASHGAAARHSLVQPRRSSPRAAHGRLARRERQGRQLRSGSVRLKAVPGITSTPADEADVAVHGLDHRRAQEVRPRRLHGRAAAEPRCCASRTSLNGLVPSTRPRSPTCRFPVTVPCAPTRRHHRRLDVLGSTRPPTRSCPARSRRSSARSGSSARCRSSTAARTGWPHDAGNTLFAVQGVFAP